MPHENLSRALAHRHGEISVAMHFQDRAHAGRVLAAQLRDYSNRGDVTVVALPRGGVPVAYEVACALNAPLDVLIVRKLGVPGYEELAMGAIASGGSFALNPEVVAALGEHASDAIDRVAAAEERELLAREERYRDGRPPPDLHGRCVILIDDGLATGATMRAAVQAARQLGGAHIIVAVPVAPESTCREMRQIADAVICVMIPELFYGVGQFYEHFGQTSDEEVRELLERSAKERSVRNDEQPQ